ncbi:MAG: site-specific integrase [Pseudobacteriovorax sp.]|nr:site-specific integrase [Pseudobacteriovorax sp.]
MPKISYEVSSTEVKPFTYRTPIVSIDEHGELQVYYSKTDPVHIKQITFLNLIGRDEKGNIVSKKPIEEVNNFLMARHIDEGREESNQHSKALIHFFAFLTQLQEKWDDAYDEEKFDELVDLPRPTWDFMPFRKNQRITYLYRAALKYSVIKEPDRSLRLARTTATAYMNNVVGFYKFHLRTGKIFNNPPFDHEVVSINIEANGQSMKAYMSKVVHTTDLRLNFPKSSQNQGAAGEPGRRDLSPISDKQWAEVKKILMDTRRVIKNVKGEDKWVSLAKEYCLFFLIGRYTGLRKEEVATLHSKQIVTPPKGKSVLWLGVGVEYGSATKDVKGDDKSRKTIIPSTIMRLLYEYMRSDRYEKRLVKFKALCAQKKADGEDAFFDSVDGVDENKEYLFLSGSGVPFFLKLTELNVRWGEIRRTVRAILGHDMQGSIHNLRPTFAVSLFRTLLKTKSHDKALAMVSACLGHEDLDTTMKYLTLAKDAPTGDEIYEDILEFVGVFDELDEPAEGDANV